MGLINDKYWGEAAEKQLKQDFDNAEPCRHLALDDFLTDELADLFISNEDDIIKTTPNRPRTIGLRLSYRM